MDDSSRLHSIPKDFGPFELIEKIGSGGMGLVFLAMQKSLKRKVVLKILHSHFADDETLVSRFEREATAAAQLRHPNIVSVIDTGRFNGIPYIAMEYVEGMDLQRWFKKHKPAPVEVALLILRDVCRGLEHAHEAGVVHRDIKPANVMLSQDGAVKIMDFGLARVISESIAMTAAGSVLGTPRYMSPEQATGEPVDARSDIFSTGVLGFELLAGQCPFAGESYSAVIHSILNNEPGAVQSYNPVVPRQCAAMIRRMLRKKAAERYGSMEEVLEALGGVLESLHLGHAKDLLRDYARDPEGTAKKLAAVSVQHHFQQGLELETRGPIGQDQAFLEFMRVLHLDPDNSEASIRVNALRSAGARLPTEEAGPGDSAPLLTSAPALPPILMASPRKKKFSISNVLVATGGILAAAAAAALVPRLFAPGATISVTTSPPGATVTVDGAAMQTPAPAVYRGLKGGTHVLKISLEGYVPEERWVWLRPNGSLSQSFELASSRPPARHAAAAPPPATPASSEEASAPAADASRAALSIRSTPGGASVYLDGKSMGHSNSTFQGLKPGAHHVLVSLEGYDDREQDFVLAAGKTATLRFELSAKPSKFGLLRLRAEPGSSVSIDGHDVAAADLSQPLKVPVGAHKVHVAAPGGRPMDQDVTIAEDATQSLDYTASLGTGSLLVDTNVRLLNAAIWLDGRDTGRKTPRLMPSVTARQHTLRLVSPDYTMVGGDTTITVAQGARSDVTIRMVKR